MHTTFFNGLDLDTKDRINVLSGCGFLAMPPTEAFDLIRRTTSFDARFGPSTCAAMPSISVCAITAVPIKDDSSVSEAEVLRKEIKAQD